MSFWGNSVYAANSFLRGQTAFYNMLNWPFGFALNMNGATYYGNWDRSSNTPIQALEKNKMMYSHFAYMPYIDVRLNNGVSNIDSSQIQLAANRDILQCKVASLGTNLNNLISVIDSALKSKDLTDGQRAALEDKKAQAEAMLKDLEDFANKRSPNMEVSDALEEAEAMQGQYYDDLRESVGELMNKIQSGEDVQPVLTPEQINKEYENTTKPAIEEILNSDDVSEEDKAAIQAKQQELEKAIEEGKPQEELNRINNELWDLINGVYDKLENGNGNGNVDGNGNTNGNGNVNGNGNTNGNGNGNVNEDGTINPTPVEDLTPKQIAEKLNDEIKPAIRELEDSEYLDDEDKQEIKDKQIELRDAIRNGADEEEVQRLYKELIDLINAAKFKNEIGKLDENPNLSDNDKAKIQEKLEELEEAIANGATEEELQEIYDDLNDMISDATDDIKAAEEKADKVETEALKKVKEEYDKAIEKYENSKIAEGNELYDYLSPVDKKQLDDWFKAYEKAIEENKPASVVSNIVDNINNIVKKLEEKAENSFKEGSDIAEKIGIASRRSNGNLFKKYTEKEKTIVENVRRINKDNVVAVLRAWTAGPYWQTNNNGEKDISLLETIYSEFHWYEWNNKTRRDLTEHLLTAIEDYAKENGLEMEAKPIISTIRIQIEEKNIEDAAKGFRRLLQQVLGIPQNYGGISGSW